MTDYRYLDNWDEDRNPITDEMLVQFEIAYQLKRIADKLTGGES